MLNVLTVDVEEYFHPTEVQKSAHTSRWATFPSRIEDQIQELLSVLEKKQIKATFFVLGWIAETRPKVVRTIQAAGHEIGCHSYAHQLVYELTPEEFRRDTQRAVAAIEDACGVRPFLYRAPSYSITAESFWAMEILVECGFVYDSSIYPVAHDRYGIPGFNRFAQLIETPAGPINEIPVATVGFSGKVLPIGGGAYLRLLPYRYTLAGIRRLNGRENRPACFYFHPWELDPDQPRLAKTRVSRWRTYTGLKTMRGKLENLLKDFQFSNLTAVFPDLRQASPTVRSQAMAS